jgi:hypothetical protein
MTATAFGDVMMDERGVYAWQPAREMSASISESHRRYRLAICELALFYRGTIIVAHKITMNSEFIDYKLEGDDARRLKFASLLQWTGKCVLPTCDRLLEVLPANAGRCALAVGAKDSRIGQPKERAEISQNRLDAYYHLHAFIDGYNWNHNVCLFFLYFADLYYLNCKAQLGKTVLY